MKVAILLLGLAAVLAQAADNPAATIKEVAPLYASIVDAAGATDEFSSNKARVTVLAPSDEAVKAFLKDMGLTADDVKKNPVLADALVAYHTVLGAAAGPKELFAKNKEVEVKTADPKYKLIFKQKADGVYVQDAQGNVAKVSKAGLGSGAHTVHVVDKVLYSGSYFKNLGAVIKTFPGMFSTVAAAAKKAGLADKLTGATFAETIFLPTNEAFKKAGVDLEKTDKATLEKVLTYHVVPGARYLPAGFTDGKALATLDKGNDLTITSKDDKEGAAGLKGKRAFVTDSKGNTVMVIKPNLVIGKAVAHVVDGVLTPKAAGVSTESAKKTTSTSGRKLLRDGGDAGLRGEYAPTIGLDSSEQAILRAVNDGASQASTSQAGMAGVENVEVGSTYPEHATYADGVRGSIAALASGGN